MKMPLIAVSIFIATFILIDLYVFKAVRLLLQSKESLTKEIFYAVYWIIPLLLILLFLYSAVFFSSKSRVADFRIIYFFTGFFILFYAPKIIFIVFEITDDLSGLVGYLLESAGVGFGEKLRQSTLLLKSGSVVAVFLFFSIVYGIVFGRFSCKTENIELTFDNLPPAFNNFKIVQISDLHLGSFYASHSGYFEKAVASINAQNPDLIVFTGDMVNNLASEAKSWIPVFKKLRASYGKFSILGNHDYGTYYHWRNEEEKQENMKKLIEIHGLMGFSILLNQSTVIEKAGQKIGIAGVENWGKPPFPQYGDYRKAASRLDDVDFKILLSHDPSHWDEMIKNKTDVALTLSGHTHGFQFGFDIAGIKWSPVTLKYPKWKGLYSSNNQYLYVNVGLGYIGFPGRVGISPEITVITLKSKNNL